MRREPVSSSSIVSIGYDAGTLEIEFQNGRVYRYLGVTADVVEELRSAPSIGRYFTQRIKLTFPYEAVIEDPPTWQEDELKPVDGYSVVADWKVGDEWLQVETPAGAPLERGDVLAVGPGHLLVTSLGQNGQVGVQSYVPRWASEPVAIEGVVAGTALRLVGKG